MLAQVVLTPVESKKLIAKAIARLDIVKKAAAEGIVALHPSSSTYFIVEEITGEKPKTNYWVCGSVTSKGMCVEMGMLMSNKGPEGKEDDPREFPTWWVIKDGKLHVGERLSGFLHMMKPSDVFIKGVNALDSEGNVGVLIGDSREISLGWIISAWKKQGFNMIFPVGLEKLIPTPIVKATNEAKPAKYDYAMGMPTGLFPCPQGQNVNEIDAIECLSGAIAIPIASGGLEEAQGAITMIIKGSDIQVREVLSFIEQSKGARLPRLRLCNCDGCPVLDCKFPARGKNW